MEPSEIEHQWAIHTFDGFPREIMLKPSLVNRMPVRNFDTFRYHMWQAFGGQSSYVEVYPDAARLEKNRLLCNKIYLDLDNEQSLSVCYDEMRGFVRYMLSTYDYIPRVYFSGRKGFAVYIDFDPIQINHFSETMRALHSQWISELRLSTLDTSPIGDDRRVSRVPFTYHHVSELLCYPIDPVWSLETILKLAEGPNGDTIPVNISKCSVLPDQIMKMDEDMREMRNPEVEVRAATDEETAQRIEEYLDDIMEMFDLAPTYAEGRTRTVWAMLSPRVAWTITNGHYAELDEQSAQKVNARILEVCRDWLEQTPKTDPDGRPRKHLDTYLRYIAICLKQQRRDKLFPWNKETFWLTYPDLVKYWVHKE